MSLAKKQFSVNAAGELHWAYIWTPDKPGKFPVIFFYHGAGEVGSTEADAEKLLWNGPLYYVRNRGWYPDFIIVAIQHQPGDPNSPLPAWYDYLLPSLAWDGNEDHIMHTGLSAGGAAVIDAMGTSVKGNVFIPMSAAWSHYNFVTKKADRVIAFHDQSDPTVPYSTSRDFVKAVNNLYPNHALLIDTHFGHSEWNFFYDPYNYKVPDLDQNIYDWWLSGKLPVNVPDIVIPPITNVIPVVTPIIDQPVTPIVPPVTPVTPIDNSIYVLLAAGQKETEYSLDNTGRDATSFWWNIASRPSGSGAWLSNQGAKGAMLKSINKLGTYTLTKWTPAGTDTVTIKVVDTLPNQPAKTVDHYSVIKIYSDGTRDAAVDMKAGAVLPS
jgi:hypothetical protein